MKPLLRHDPTRLLIPILTFWCTSSALAATGSIVLESNQSSTPGSLRNGGTPIGFGDIKALPFTSGTGALDLTFVEVGLVTSSAATAGTYQVNFNLYSASATGVPQTLLYTTSFTPSITATAAWFSLPVSYSLTPSTPYAFGFEALGASVKTDVKWANTALPSIWPPLASDGYSGLGSNGYAYEIVGVGRIWNAGSADNAFRLYAVPEATAGVLPGLGFGLATFGVLRLRRRRNQDR